jgi:hypothetical protein
VARQPDAARLLASVASALTACEQAGIKVRLRHGIVDTREGYVLPVKGSWVARTRTWDRFSPGQESDDD